MMKRSSVIAAAVLLGAVAAPAVAEARVVDLRLAGNAGGMVGWGTTANTPDFFAQTRGPGFGFELGAKLLVFDFSVSFLQIVKDGGLSGTLIQGLFGTEIDIPVGPYKLDNGQSAQMLHTGIAAGVALGTGAPVSLPVTNDQLADKGFVARYRIGYEYFLNPFMGVGGELNFGYHYFLGGKAVNDTADHSSGYQGTLLANFTFHLGT
jgi:hypothetical protein